jgi:hypothetical protein
MLVGPMIGKVHNVVDEYTIRMKLVALSQFVEKNLNPALFS